MYSSISKLDRDIARSFLNAPSNTISYRSTPMRNEQNHMMMVPFDYKEKFSDEFVPQPHPNAQLDYPTNTNTIPMYYDVIIDTVTDYDSKLIYFELFYKILLIVLYPIAKQRKKYYYDQQTVSDEKPIYPRYHVQRLEELAVSIDFPHDYDSTSNYSIEHLQPIKNVRFNDNPTQIPSSKSKSADQYYFHPETISQIDNQQSSLRYIKTPFFWFRPVLNHNYAICIPTSRPSLHAYITPSFDSQTITNPIRL